MPITLSAAKRAKKQARQEGWSRSDADDYATTPKNHTVTNHTDKTYAATTLPSDTPHPSRTADELAIEPADPAHVDHEKRRQTRLAPNGYEGLTKPFYECGCGECSDAVDPLASEPTAFRDVLMAADVCSSPRPVTIEKAREIYLRYQRTAWQDPVKTSELERTQSHHGKMLGAERHIFEQMEDPTLIFLSLRLSPIEVENGDRRWIPPSTLADRLGDAWGNVRGVLDYQLREYNWEYAYVIGMTESAATPHRHVAIYVEDPNDEVGIGVAESAVNSHVNNCKGAYPEDHPVEPDQSDAGRVFHDIPKADAVRDETLTQVYRQRRTQSFSLPSVHLYYMANQQPHWALKNVYDGDSDINSDSTHVEGAAIAWALSWRIHDSSDDFVDGATKE